MNNNQHFVLTKQPLTFGSFQNWITLLFENKGVDLKYIPRASFVSLLSFLTVPLRIAENIKIEQKIKNITIDQEPIFILGHWRSGTTYLHNLMSMDENFGYISTFQGLAPELFLEQEKLIRTIIELILPETRPMDQVKVSLDAPWEEEFAMGNISPYSFYHGWYFPKNMKHYFDKFVLFNGDSAKIIDCWKKEYLKIIKKASISDKKKLILKNPANTGRINTLLEMFPKAKFIHIHRNPYFVYLSTKKLYQNFLPLIDFQDISEEEIEDNIFIFYKQIMNKFFEDKKNIPPENFMEIRYEELEKNPILELEKIYQVLNITDFKKAKINFTQYINSQRKYRKNKYLLSEREINRITQEWKFTIDKWNYNVPDSILNTVNSN